MKKKAIEEYTFGQKKNEKGKAVKVTMAIPSYWARESAVGWKEGDAIYDHPTPLDREGTLLGAIRSVNILKDKDDVRQHIGIVFQEPALDIELTGRENLDFHARMYAMGREKRKERISDWIIQQEPILVENDFSLDEITSLFDFMEILDFSNPEYMQIFQELQDYLNLDSLP